VLVCGANSSQQDIQTGKNQCCRVIAFGKKDKMEQRKAVGVLQGNDPIDYVVHSTLC
jgi:hypothetical protein